jgi:hypothetical protein
MSLAEMVYIVAGCLLPMFYVPQIRRCLRDDGGLVAYSIRKSGYQFALRLVMMPFICSIGNQSMTFIVGLDLAGRGAELMAAITSLRSQGQTWPVIALRLLPAGVVRLFPAGAAGCERGAAAAGQEPGTGADSGP